MNLKSVNIYGAYLQTIQGYSIANSFTQKTLFVAKIQFNSLGPNLLLNSNRSFSSILLPPILYHTCTTPVPHPYRVDQPSELKNSNLEFIVHYCSCMIKKTKTITKCFDFNHLYAFLQPKTDFYLQNNL